MVLRLAVDTEPSEQWNVARLLRKRIKEALDEAGIEIPFPIVNLGSLDADRQPAESRR